MSNQTKKTEYSDYAAEMRDKLNTVSPSFCLAKWLQVSLHLPQGRTQSCYHPPTHQIPVDLLKNKPSVLHNTPQKIEERRMMMKGERPEGCSYCWKMEDAPGGDEHGHMSDRHYRSSEWWAAPNFDEVVENGADWDVSPRYVEVNFNQACNFKCMYCSPHLSTTWHEEIKTHGPYQLNNFRHNDLDALKNLNLMPLQVSQKENPYVTAFWEWWPTIYDDLRVFRMTGGEPLIDTNTFKILDYVYEHPNKNLELSITSNLCPPDQKLFDKFIEKVKKLDSVDFSVECYVPDPKDNTPWQTWQNYIIGKDKKEYHKSVLPSIEREEIKQTFPEVGQCLETDDNSFTYIYDYKDKAYKHFMLYVSLDSVGDQSEYIRHGLEFNRLLSNVRQFLTQTRHSSITFINTFNILSIPNLIDFLKIILKLRKEFGYKNQNDYSIPNIEYTGSGSSSNSRFQRIWFDIPVLRFPNWFAIQNAGEWGIEEVKRAIKFMEDNVQDENYSKSFEGFKPHEILKLKRNLALMEEGIGEKEIRENKINFYKFIKQHDQRRNTNFLKTFPEYETFYNECKKEAEL